MQVTQVTNNYSQVQKYKNPGFGRLIIKSDVPLEIAEAALSSRGVRKLSQLFHNVGKDVIVAYERIPGAHSYSSIRHYEQQPLLKVGQRILKKFSDCQNDFGTVTDSSRKLKKFSAREGKKIFEKYEQNINAGAEYLDSVQAYNNALINQAQKDKKPKFPPFSNILISSSRR